MIIYRDTNDILHLFIKERKTRWTLEELSQTLLIPKASLNGMLVHLQCHGYIKAEKINNQKLYSLINA